MGKGLKFFYDREGDILDISFGEPQEAVSREVTDDFFVRVQPDTEKVVGFSVLNFMKSFKDLKETGGGDRGMKKGGLMKRNYP